MTSVTVNQITSHGDRNRSYFNVEEGPLHVRVIGHSYGHPTALIRSGYSFELVQFDSQAMADEWIRDNAGRLDGEMLWLKSGPTAGDSR